jgi:hypothetical protein
MSEIFKVSFVVRGEDHPGAILNLDERPEIGDSITLGDRIFEVREVLELIPPRGDFHFLHVTLRPAPSPT